MAVIVLVLGEAAAFVAARLTAPTTAPGPVATSVAGAGPTYLLNGVPMGYAHTEAGAVMAATSYVRVLEGLLVAYPDRYRAAVSTMADPAAGPDLLDMAGTTLGGVGNISPGLTQAVAQGRAVVQELHPIRYHVDSYTADRAVVSIWGVSLQAIDGEREPLEVWATEALTVKWVSGDWRLFQVADGQYGGVGPSPRNPQPPPQTTALPAQLRDFTEYAP
jgi:hypothetical protein